MPATSGVAALVPPTKAMLWPRAGAALHARRSRRSGSPGSRPRTRRRRAPSACPSVAKDCAGCHHGRLSNVLCPPPPPAARVERRGIGGVVPRAGRGDRVRRRRASGWSRRPRAPTARSPATRPGAACRRASSWSAGTPCAQAEEPVSPAATTTVMPSAALRRELALDERARGGVGGHGRLAHPVGDGDHVAAAARRSRSPAAAARAAGGSRARRRRRRPRRDRAPRGRSARAAARPSRRPSRRASSRGSAGSSRRVDLQRRAGEAEAGAELVDVVGRRRRLADDRERTPWPCRPAAWSGAMPYAVRSWPGRGPAARDERAGNCVVEQHGPGVPVRVGVPPSNGAAPRARATRATRRLALLHGQPHAGDRVDVALHALGQLRRVHGQRDDCSFVAVP